VIIAPPTIPIPATHTRARAPHPLQSPVVSDVRALHEMLEPLQSYHPFWLRAGLMTVLRGDLLGGGGGGGGGAHTGSGVGSTSNSYRVSGGGEDLQAAARKGLVVLVREGLLCERAVNTAPDKQAAWVSALRRANGCVWV
jgi:hypothetical protein